MSFYQYYFGPYLKHYEDQYIMTGKKRGIKARTSYFIGSSKKGLKKGAPNVVGKVGSNFVGTEFHVYTAGKNPGDTKNVDQMRSEVAVVRYVKSDELSKLSRRKICSEARDQEKCSSMFLE